MTELAATTPRVIDEVAALLPGDVPADVADAVFAGLHRQARKLETGP